MGALHQEGSPGPKFPPCWVAAGSHPSQPKPQTPLSPGSFPREGSACRVYLWIQSVGSDPRLWPCLGWCCRALWIALLASKKLEIEHHPLLSHEKQKRSHLPSSATKPETSAGVDLFLPGFSWWHWADWWTCSLQTAGSWCAPAAPSSCCPRCWQQSLSLWEKCHEFSYSCATASCINI